MKYRRVWLTKRKGKRRPAHHMQWYDEKGHMRSESAGSDRKRAEMWRRRKEYEINLPDYVEVQRIECSKFREEFLEMERTRVAKGTVALTKAASRLFFSIVEVKYMCDINTRHAEHFRKVRLEAGRSPHTVNKETRHLAAMFNKAKNLNYVRQNPFDGLRPIPAPQKPIRVLSPREIQTLLDTAGDDLVATLLLRLLIETGARLGEAVNLEFSDIDTERGIVFIRVKENWRPKNRKNRMIFISPLTCELIERLKATTPFSYLFDFKSKYPVHMAHQMFKRIVMKAGVKYCTPHDLRKTVISQLAMLGINQAVAQRFAGHQSLLTTTTYYTSIADETVRKAAEMLPWWGK